MLRARRARGAESSATRAAPLCSAGLLLRDSGFAKYSPRLRAEKRRRRIQFVRDARDRRLHANACPRGVFLVGASVCRIRWRASFKLRATLQARLSRAQAIHRWAVGRLETGCGVERCRSCGTGGLIQEAVHFLVADCSQTSAGLGGQWVLSSFFPRFELVLPI